MAKQTRKNPFKATKVRAKVAQRSDSPHFELTLDKDVKLKSGKRDKPYLFSSEAKAYKYYFAVIEPQIVAK